MDYRSRYHEVDKERAVLAEKLKQNVAAEVLHGTSLSVGALFLGMTPKLWENGPYGHLLLGRGSFLWAGQ